MKHVVLTALLCCAPTWVSAQSIYRCGAIYTHVPCLDGRVVEATDSRTAAQRAEAKSIAISERKLASELKRDRLAQEADIKPSKASSLGDVSAPNKPTSAAERGKGHHKKGVRVTRLKEKNFNLTKPLKSKARRL
jgi:hypothetical protein